MDEEMNNKNDRSNKKITMKGITSIVSIILGMMVGIIGMMIGIIGMMI